MAFEAKDKLHDAELEPKPITQTQEIGYFWSYTLEVTTVEPIEGARKSPTRTEKATLSGHEDSSDVARNMLSASISEIHRKLRFQQ